MARFDVHPRPDGPGYLLDVQSDLLGRLNTRVVVPLLPGESGPAPAQRLNPGFTVHGKTVWMHTQFMAAIPAGELGAPLARLDHEREAILSAIDFLHQGW